MKKPWLRGVLLGVSLVLLLSGGVALAQGPVCNGEVSVLGEQFGNGWSDHWTDVDNADRFEFT